MDLKIKLGLNKGIQTGTVQIAKKGVSVYSVSGVVYDADGSTLVSGATVALGVFSATSAANGTYTISNIPGGTSGSLTCTKTGYSWTAISISAMAANLTAQNFVNTWWAAGGLGGNVIAAYKAIGAASLAASYVNLANPGTGNAVVGVAPTWAAETGWTFNGSDQYLVSPAIDQSTGFVSVRVSSGSGFLFGHSVSTSSRFFLALRAGDVRYVIENLDSVKEPALATGVLGWGYAGAYRNGVAESVSTPQPVSDSKVHVIGGMGNNGSPTLFYTGNMQAYVAHSVQPTPTQAGILYAAMAALP